MRITTTTILFALLLGVCPGAGAAETAFAGSGGKWTLDGGPAWRDRVGPGLSVALGGAACDDDWCEDRWDSRLAGSLDGTIGFFYRIVPNAVVFFDLGTALLPAASHLFDDDHGFLFRTVAGAEFHVPITGWIEVFAGLGVGFAALRFRGEIERTDIDVKETLLGADIELRTGATVYLFSRAPTLGLGVYYRIGFAVWPTACVDVEDGEDDCDDVDDLIDDDDDDLPFLHHVGLEMRYGF